MGLLIIAGLWTRVGVLIAIVEAWSAFSSGSLGDPMILGALGGTLAMIAPGAWSVNSNKTCATTLLANVDGLRTADVRRRSFE